VLQKVYQRRLVCIQFLTLIGGAALVECASAQYSNTYVSAANRVSPSIALGNPVASGNTALLPPPTATSDPWPNQQAPFEGAAANPSFSAGRPDRTRERTSLETIAPQAQAHIDYALNLAERGAVQSAQAEFIMALDLIADALDADTRNTTRAHARAVQAGLTAIKETKDFVPADSPHDIGINLAQLAATHQTPVLKNIDMTCMSRADALQSYHTYATQQLAFAGGRSAIASSALYGLGRSASITLAGASTRNPLGAPNAMALYQAALLVDPQNYMASNELGVLMARYGDLEGAAGQLVHSLSVRPQLETWHNLATVYRRMGQSEKAEQAEGEREKMLVAARSRGATTENSNVGSRPTLQWVDADAFAASATPYGLDGPAVSANKSVSIAQRDTLGKRMTKWIPWPKSDKPQQNADTSQLNPNADPSHGGEADGRSLVR
jgi:tetratricopeptide (TPR) repeat protein